MSTQQRRKSAPRTPLSRDRVLRAAVQVADAGGIDSLTMRRLAEELGAEAMSLYYHVANKEQVLDGIVEVIAAEINEAVAPLDLSSADGDWVVAARARILRAREVLLRHPWAPQVFESRSSTSPAIVKYHDDLIAVMRGGGLSFDLIHHGLHALGSRALGFSQELFSPTSGSDEPEPSALDAMSGTYPNIVGMLAEVAHNDPDSTLGWCDDQTEFVFGLDLILDGLERMRARA